MMMCATAILPTNTLPLIFTNSANAAVNHNSILPNQTIRVDGIICSNPGKSEPDVNRDFPDKILGLGSQPLTEPILAAKITRIPHTHFLLARLKTLMPAKNKRNDPACP